MRKSFSRVIAGPLRAFLREESSSGILLGACAVIAMILANTPASEIYFQILNFKISNLDIHHWINDGLMTIFFFLVGMEIKREIVTGELSTLRKAALPIAAALGGMIVPALIFIFFNNGTVGARGWAIPMATDIAFALGVLALFGSRVPLSLKIFLLALAIVDDLGAVLVIAFFYTDEIRTVGLVAVGLTVIAVILAKHLKFRSYFLYFVLGIIAWAGTLYSGVHATVAGVMLGLLTPNAVYTDNKTSSSYSPLNDLIHVLHPWVGFVIMPVFALANAGVALGDVNISEIASHSIFSGVSFGLLIGKPIGVLVFSFIAVILGLAVLPKDLRWNHIVGVSFLAGIGFTMALFISALSLDVSLAVYAKTAILAASVISGIFGFIWLKLTLSR